MLFAGLLAKITAVYIPQAHLVARPWQAPCLSCQYGKTAPPRTLFTYTAHSLAFIESSCAARPFHLEALFTALGIQTLKAGPVIRVAFFTTERGIPFIIIIHRERQHGRSKPKQAKHNQMLSIISRGVRAPPKKLTCVLANASCPLLHPCMIVPWLYRSWFAYAAYAYVVSMSPPSMMPV